MVDKSRGEIRPFLYLSLGRPPQHYLAQFQIQAKFSIAQVGLAPVELARCCPEHVKKLYLFLQSRMLVFREQITKSIINADRMSRKSVI